MEAKTVMIVDDQPDIRYTIKTLLERNNFRTIEAVDGRDCLKKLKRFKPDLILLDIMMPVISGWDVCSKIKTTPETRNIPVIFLTAKSDEISQTMSLQGGDGYVSKPFDIYKLVNLIKEKLK